MALGPNQQFSFPGTQLLNNTQVIGLNNNQLIGQGAPNNYTQPYDMTTLMNNSQFNTVQAGELG